MTSTHQNLPVLTVSQLTNAIKMSLESAFPLIWLQGEVSNYKLHTSGHLYFSLKDSNAQIAAVMYRGDALHLKTLPKDGMQIIVRGELNVFPPSGKYQIIIKELRPVGLGELLLRLEELKVKLHKKGYFKASRKKLLPKFPKKIGVITSPTGAAIQDILNVLTRRFSGFQLLLNPVKVQGEGAAQEIAMAIHQLNAHSLVDVIIVGRGGGSIEDLWAFNEEIVAEAIYASRIPIISAVGHETDHCIADYVADVRAPTPSAAAEIVIAEKTQQIRHLSQVQQRLQQTMRHITKHQRQRLSALSKHPLLHTPYGILGPWMQRADNYRQDYDSSILQKIRNYKLLLEGFNRHVQGLNPLSKLGYFRTKLAYFEKGITNTLFAKINVLRKRMVQIDQGIDSACRQHIKNRRRLLSIDLKYKYIDSHFLRSLKLCRERLANMDAALKSINPKNLLTKGYCILFAENDVSVITSIHALEEQQKVRMLLADGEALSTINKIISQ